MSAKRRRVAKKDVRTNAKTSSGGGGQNYFNLPAKVETWHPKKAGVYELNLLPYEVETDTHPDRASANIEPGMLWYKHPFMVHHSIGAANESVVCPVSVGKPCPICQERTKLAKDYEKNEEAIKALRAQKYVAYNLLDPDDSDKVVVFAISKGKFANALEQELTESGDENMNFYDVTDEGRTLKVRFSEASFEGRKYFEVTRIDFIPRDEMDEDETIKRVVCLDNIFKVLPFEDLKTKWLQIDEDDAKPARGKTKPDDDDDGDGEAEKPAKAEKKDKPKKGDTPTFKKGQKVKLADEDGTEIIGTIIDIDGKDVVVEDKNGEELDASVDDLTLVGDEDSEPKKKPKKDDDDEPPAKAEKKDKPKKKDDDDEPPAKADKKAKFAVGDRVQFTNRKGVKIVGKLTDVDEDDVTVEDDSGDDHFADLKDLEAAGKSKPKADKEDEPAFDVGASVTWDDGDKSGKIVKIHSSGEKAKVVDSDDEESWVMLTDLKLKKK